MKLFNAFKAESDLPTLHTNLNTLAVKLKQQANAMFHDYVAREAAYFYDLFSMGLESTTIHPYRYCRPSKNVLNISLLTCTSTNTIFMISVF